MQCGAWELRRPLRGRGPDTVKPSQSLKVAVFILHGCNTNEEWNDKLRTIFLRQKWRCVLMPRQMRRGWDSVFHWERELLHVMEWKKVHTRLMLVWLREPECLVFVSAYGLGIESSEEYVEGFCNEINDC